MSATTIPSKPIQRDPYKALGLGHDATPSQIKATYRKLALKYHPDRQTRRQSEGNATPNDATPTDKFVEIAAAYALLSDPVRKREYDHLYKFGAFDASNGESDSAHHNNNPGGGAKCMNYKYTEDYSGGYYTSANDGENGATSSSSSARQSHLFRSQSTASQDSFFDDLIYSPTSKKNKTFFGTAAAFSSADDASSRFGSSSNNRFDGVKRKPGIGFAFPPLGKHLSIHIPSRNEIVMSMAKGERLHNFGTRVTFSSQKVESNGVEGTRLCPGFDTALNCTNQSVRCSKKFVSTTTRIAKGQHRVVKRTAYLHPDGKKEVVVEENGVVRQRYVEDFSKDTSGPSTPHRGNPPDNPSEEEHKGDRVDEMPMNPSSSVQEEKENDRPWYSDIIRGMQCVMRPCFAPCGPVLATVPE
eukprot:CCRYP_012536-RA/>CCRYP_012536-RA protein AED:0.22 eAED:0.22 QI:342/1/1/1/1/1/2/123/413